MPIGEEVSFNSRLADILGNFYTNYLVKIEQDVITEKRRNQKGQIIFDIANINSGYYLFLCKVQNSLISFPIIIQR